MREEVELSTLTAVSPVDGRYARRTAPLRGMTSEYALIGWRVNVEVAWFKHLADDPAIAELPQLSPAASKYLEDIVTQFDPASAEAVKVLERTTNHDVKAVEYYLKERLQGHPELGPVLEFVHFGCTSEDVNNVAYALMLKQAREAALAPRMRALVDTLDDMARAYADAPMLSHTHGQAATPTTMGKELAVFAARLARQLAAFERVEVLAKFNGAVGNYNAHAVAYPKLDWPAISRRFIESLGLVQNPLTTQIESHDWIAEYLHPLCRFNRVLLDLNQDLWGYISLGYFSQRKIETETGSSTMPHKVNPIDFENSEGNVGIANALLMHLAEKLPVSRWQRDLSDSTALRSLGTGLAHCLVAFESNFVGLGKLELSRERMSSDLEGAWEVLSEALQTVMRKHGIAEPYERLKALTRGEHLTAQGYRALVEALELPVQVRKELLELTPAAYTGLAEALVRQRNS
ncbi:MAG: adenylosuccinate lyase [Pseudomonadales bacterium]